MSQDAARPPMGRIVAFHQRPPDPETWLEYYQNVHLPIVRKIPGLQNIRWGKVLQTTDGSQAPCWLISDVYFKDMDSLEAALETPEMKEAFADTAKFILPGNVQIMFCEAQDTAPLEQPQSV
jgi:uncharacterized protein (TIGR02118 family)